MKESKQFSKVLLAGTGLAAPPRYRPQPVPKVLQLKTITTANLLHPPNVAKRIASRMEDGGTKAVPWALPRRPVGATHAKAEQVIATKVCRTNPVPQGLQRNLKQTVGYVSGTT